ncbi:MAG: hypothetical protein Kow0037_28840 [Calditrichia bacterium]
MLASFKTSLFFLMALLLVGSMACSSGKMIKRPPQIASFAENQFFVLDFEKQLLSLKNVESRFFTTFPHDEPTGGQVVYDRRQWVNQGMIRLRKGDGLYLYLKSRGEGQDFDSFRLTSKSFYNLNEQTPGILFVFKGKLPSGKGIWPAWWLNGSREKEWIYAGRENFPDDEELDKYSGIGHFYNTSSPVNGTDWPSAGELDIIETINGDNIVHNTLHTCPQMCDAIWNGGETVINCANARDDDPNAGCSGKPYQLDEPRGTFACLWEENRIRFYYWSPEEDVREMGGPLSEHPDPTGWDKKFLKNTVILLDSGTPCEDSLHQQWQCRNCAEANLCRFVNMKMIFNTTLCGKWAGSRFNDSDNPTAHCNAWIRGEGRQLIDGQFLKIEYVGVRPIE